jgi:hypothetical protein
MMPAKQWQVLILAAHNISTMMAKLGLQDKDMAASAEAIQRNIPTARQSPEEA